MNLRGVQFRDIDGDGRADLLIPVKLQVIPEKPGAKQPDPVPFLLVFHNLPARHEKAGDMKEILSRHFHPTPQLITNPGPFETPDKDEVNDLFVDLNGDGLMDLVAIKKASPDQMKQGIILQITNVRMNLGVKFVPERDIALSVLDARLGYIASYAQTLLQG